MTKGIVRAKCVCGCGATYKAKPSKSGKVVRNLLKINSDVAAVFKSRLEDGLIGYICNEHFVTANLPDYIEKHGKIYL